MRPALIVFGLAAVACASEAPQPPISTIPLPPPELTQPAFEPHISIDPNDSHRIIVSAQYGISRNRGGRKIWTWGSEDGGRTWRGAEMPLPSAVATMAADAVTTFALDGSAVMTFLFADSVTFQGGAAVTRSAPDNLIFGPASVVVRDRLTEGGGAIDKGWLAVDRGVTSPLRGAIYLSWHANRPLPNRMVESVLWLATSRNGAKNWSEPVKVSEHFGGQVAVRSSGALDLVFADRDGRVLLHAPSDEGGLTFGGADTIAVTEAGRVFDLPSLAITPGDTVVVCWAQGPETDSRGYAIRCGVNHDGGWATVDLEPSPLAPRSAGFPAVAANPSGIWVVSYAADSATVSARIHRSVDGGRTYQLYQTLASRPFGLDRFCPAPSAPCRRTLNQTGAYFPGDYVGIAAANDRVVTAVALPEGNDATGRSSIFVTIIPQNRWSRP